MPPDSTATKNRILEAAFLEFANHGLAGARVDRIGLAAAANKRLIYVYFGNKEALFDTVVTTSINQVASAAPFTPDNLPGYAGELFDYLVSHPEHLRIAFWAQLERPVLRDSEQESYKTKIDAMVNGGVAADADDAVDTLSLLLGLATSWFTASPALRGLATEAPFSPERLSQHRSALVTAAQALASISAP